MKLKKKEVVLEYVNYIQSSPVGAQNLYSTACGNDGPTINKWRDIWLKNIKANKAKFGSFADKSIGKLYNSQRYKPVIVAGSGPSLASNGHELAARGDICLVSCLHNFHFFEDRDVKVDYYVTLDAGEVTIEEVSEGGSKTEEEYWEITKDRTLLAYIGTSPKLLEKWRGEVLFYNAPQPDPVLDAQIDEVEKFSTYVSSGGNVLGASVYIAKAIMGANPIAFVGADFSFSYDKKFHGWDSKYDINLGTVMRSVDVFGNKVLTWPSYHGFKCYFDWMAETVPGIYINCTEGGTFGAYNEGNIMSVRQMDLQDFFGMYHLNDVVKENALDPQNAIKRVLY